MGLQATPSTFKQSSSALKPLRYSGLYKISLSFLEGKKKKHFFTKNNLNVTSSELDPKMKPGERQRGNTSEAG